MHLNERSLRWQIIRPMGSRRSFCDLRRLPDAISPGQLTKNFRSLLSAMDLLLCVSRRFVSAVAVFAQRRHALEKASRLITVLSRTVAISARRLTSPDHKAVLSAGGHNATAAVRERDERSLAFSAHCQSKQLKCDAVKIDVCSIAFGSFSKGI